MKWLLGTVAVVVIAVVAWGAYFSFDFKSLRTEAIDAAPANAAEKMAAKKEMKVELNEDQRERAKEHSKGDVNAPIAMYEFSSFTCSHCRTFHLEAMPNLQKYIDEGKLVVYFKDIPMERKSAVATLLSRCMTDNDSYWKFLQVLFETQAQWALSNDYENLLMNYASMQGLDKERAKECMNDKTLLKALIVNRDNYADAYSIMGTPTIILAYDGKTEQVNHAAAGKYIAEKIENILKEKASAVTTEKQDEKTEEDKALAE